MSDQLEKIKRKIIEPVRDMERGERGGWVEEKKNGISQRERKMKNKKNLLIM